MTPAPNAETRANALPLSSADLRGLARLGVDGTLGLTDLVEAMHHTISSRIGLATKAPRDRSSGRTSGIAGAVYGAVRGTTRLVGRGVDAAWRQLEGDVPSLANMRSTGPERDAFVAVLNGVFGDHLADSGNPLAIPMALRQGGVALTLERASLAAQVVEPRRKLLVLVHGLCMNDRQWARRGHDHGQALAHELGFTAIYLHYNSGRHVSQNGSDFAELLEQLCAHWPVPLDELVIVGHSMGGLVARSACWQANTQRLTWRGSLKKLVCLGTPHHGAPLERGGRWLDTLLGLSRYAAPFARLGQVRSAGITDLRFGNLCDADWQGRDRHAQQHDDRRPTPLPEGVGSYLLAATTANARPPEVSLLPSEGTDAARRRSWAHSDIPGRLHRALIGDGLVPLASALGEHRDPAHALVVADSHRHIVSACGHLDLLCHAEVFAQLRRWLGPG